MHVFICFPAQGTHYKRLVDMYYDGLVHPISIFQFQADLTNFNHSNTFPTPHLHLTCTCKAYNEDPCQGELLAVRPAILLPGRQLLPPHKLLLSETK